MKRGGNRNEQLGNIWDVVSNLAQALTDARDQLIGLINFPGTTVASDRNVHRFRNASGFPHQHGKENVDHNNGFEDFHVSNALARYRGGGYTKKFGVPSSKKIKSIHRQHARGHVAFGAHSEFKPQPPCHRKPVNTGTSMGSSMGSRCKRVGGKKGVQIGLFLDPKSNCLQINTKKGMGNPVNINFLPNQPSPSPDQYTCKKDPNCRPSSPDTKRHCIGTQYAALLKEEAFRIRERRLAEDQKAPNSKPKWTRC